MYVIVDLAIGAVELADPGALHDFSVVVAHGADVARAEEVLVAASAGHLDEAEDEGAEPDHAWISVAWLRGAAAGRVGDSWDQHFEKMLHKARDHGWVDDGGAYVKGHISWPDEEESTGT